MKDEELKPRTIYRLSELVNSLWDNSHPVFGRPTEMIVVYLGSIQGTRRWHVFEVPYRGRDAGVLLMNDLDLTKITIEEI